MGGPKPRLVYLLNEELNVPRPTTITIEDPSGKIQEAATSFTKRIDKHLVQDFAAQETTTAVAEGGKTKKGVSFWDFVDLKLKGVY
ncbi:hypothetical protein L198_08158 [Cryptococcus wingfieldii CBS 7118]|uniref:Uncharacterized protein n=1 Tax=Cryptococcus wingfieldii CBS 7118 TaxID=1295528 RepID=A0A1E3HH04_9TREE|nr:hypothetical protein L198_08158 [Cryptococcus wingfieldii CBS 7118]ODN75628.1 hypothetical protein L198_08158 [Cryptococcus wingfieldii CBS 7118]